MADITTDKMIKYCKQWGDGLSLNGIDIRHFAERLQYLMDENKKVRKDNHDLRNKLQHHCLDTQKIEDLENKIKELEKTNEK